MTALLDLPAPCDVDVEDRIQAVFGLQGDARAPSVGKESLRAYHRYLTARLSFPFKADHYSETEPLVFDHAVTVVGLLDPEKHPADASGSLLCTAFVRGHEVNLPLAELKTEDDTVNRRLIEDYCYWFWNCQ